jgi:Tfp pilus assembly protein PilO
MNVRGNNKPIVAMLVIAGLAVAFWMVLIAPKRQEAGNLSKQVETLEASLAQHQSEAATALAARREFPTNYTQLVVLGKAVPADSETASLLVQIQRIAERTDVRFEEISLDSEGGEEAAAVAPEGAEGATTESVSPTEVAASTMPLGATVGPAGLGVMPYTLNFTGDFFQVADFIHGLDELVETANAKVAVTGRLITVNSFTLTAAPDQGFPRLQATFSVTTYLTPPEQGLTAGATPSGPAPTATATPAAETIGGTP